MLTRNNHHHVNYTYILDNSHTSGLEDYYPTRLAAMKKAILAHLHHTSAAFTCASFSLFTMSSDNLSFLFNDCHYSPDFTNAVNSIETRSDADFLAALSLALRGTKNLPSHISEKQIIVLISTNPVITDVQISELFKIAQSNGSGLHFYSFGPFTPELNLIKRNSAEWPNSDFTLLEPGDILVDVILSSRSVAPAYVANCSIRDFIMSNPGYIPYLYSMRHSHPFIHDFFVSLARELNIEEPPGDSRRDGQQGA
jgi:hypothetical protein